MPHALIVEDVTLTRFAHREAIYLVFLIVSYSDLAPQSAAPAQQMRGYTLFSVFV
jgi:hypothetical protein